MRIRVVVDEGEDRPWFKLGWCPDTMETHEYCDGRVYASFWTAADEATRALAELVDTGEVQVSDSTDRPTWAKEQSDEPEQD